MFLRNRRRSEPPTAPEMTTPVDTAAMQTPSEKKTALEVEKLLLEVKQLKRPIWMSGAFFSFVVALGGMFIGFYKMGCVPSNDPNRRFSVIFPAPHSDALLPFLQRRLAIAAEC